MFVCVSPGKVSTTTLHSSQGIIKTKGEFGRSDSMALVLDSNLRADHP